jgi:hypothetical protein
LIKSIPIRQCPSVFMNALCQHCASDNFILDVAQFSPATPVTLLVSCKLSFMTVGFKMYSLPHLKSVHPTQRFIMHLQNLSNTCSGSSQILFCASSLLSLVGAYAFRIKTSHQHLLSNVFYSHSLRNSTLLTVDIILLCTKNPLPN